MALSNPATGQEIINEINNKVNSSGGTITGDLALEKGLKTDTIYDLQGNQMFAKKGSDIVGKDNIQIMQIVSGYYTGDGESEQNINLGFRPKFVIIKDTYTKFGTSSQVKGGVPTVVLDGSPVYNRVEGVSGGTAEICEIISNGMKVFAGSGASNYRDLNIGNTKYHYIAGK